MLLILIALLGGSVDHGRYDVGYQRHEKRVSVWYPATTDADAPRMTVRRYAGSGATELEAFLRSAGLSDEGVKLYLDSPTAAADGGTPFRRSFPLVLIAHGNMHDAADQAILAESIASHGFIVAATPSPMLGSPMKSVDEIVKYAERQASELAASVEVAQSVAAARSEAMVVIGHSFGARAALLLAMRDRRIAALVSLDGGIGTATGAAAFRRAPSFDEAKAPAILHLYSDVDEFMKPDFALLDSLNAPSLKKHLVPGLRHAHFTTAGFAAAAIPEMALLTKATPGVAEAVRDVARMTLEFVKRYASGRATQTGRCRESGFSPARSEISAPSLPSSRHSKRFRTYWPKRSPEIPASSAASTSSRASCAASSRTRIASSPSGLSSSPL